ncbi:ATP-binding protein [Baia soyae]|uniref:IstB-like ATP binding protein n=1 Tax=Baia soyae TaxID=1544746 RepID=A0A4V2SWZ1_9BACL|nr:ATP-binding protein [Baia soyae]TCP64026.1 IstB-like ATP binding protein [Baia soyae]
MIQQERLNEVFQTFGWVRIPEVLHQLAEEASRDNISYLEFLDKLLSEELLSKQERAVQMRKRLARLPFLKTLDQFDFSFQPSIDEKRIRDLSSLRFIEHQENLVFLGPPGVGKTHLAVSLGLKALENRYSVYFVTAHDMVQTLQQSCAKGTVQRRVKTFTKHQICLLLMRLDTEK